MKADILDTGITGVRVSSPHFCIMPAAALEITSPHLCITPAAAVDLYREPLINIRNTADRFVITFEMPGVAEKGIEVTLSGRFLEVEGRKMEIKADEELTHAESVAGLFYKGIELPEDVDAKAARTEIQNGVLNVTLPKKKPSKAIRVK